jgi:hypothetical protein
MYHSFFDESDNNRLKGEATPAYMYCREAPRRIWQYNPNIKIIVILRNPIERAFSHWNMEVQRGAENLSFSEAIDNESARCRLALPNQHYIYSYLDRGFYTSQIRELWRFFKFEQVLLLKHDDLKKNHRKTINKVFDFLEVSCLDVTSSEPLEEKVLHRAKYNNKLDEALKIKLVNFYRFEILQLELLLGWDCSEWLT